MNIRDNPVLRERLAAEYVLGTLRGGARRRFDSWMGRDAQLRAAVAQWQARLGSMAELGRPVQPPAAVWSGIERRLWPAERAPWWQFWRVEAARPWAGMAIAASGAAIVLGVLLAGQGPGPAPAEVAALNDGAAHTGVVVTADPQHGRMAVRVAQDVHVPDDRTLQLWAINKAGKPRSLGILPNNSSTELALDRAAVGQDVILLAVSLEPKGGSPDPNGPTGPVLWKGSWTRL